MKTLTPKQKERNERKKKKLAALANLVKLNDKDRQVVVMPESKAESEELGTKVDDYGFTKVNNKKKTGKNKVANSVHAYTHGEPITKKPKVTEDTACISQSSDVCGAHGDSMKQIKLSEKEYKELKKELRERKRQLENMPAVRLKDFGEKALLSVEDEERTPLFLTDIQHLAMLALLGKHSPCSPERWCCFEKSKQLSHTVVLTLEGLSLYHYLSNENKFEETKKVFETRLEVIMPPCKEGSIIEELAQVPLTCVQAEQLIEKHGSLEAALELNKDPTLLIKNIFPVANAPVEITANDLHPNDKFPRTKLLLSALQMVDEGYPMPLRGELSKHFASYVFTKPQYTPVTNRSPLFGVDCEMCRTVKGYNELTRISIVNENLETVYETLVRPNNKIIDYLTPYSGITPEIMKSVTKTLKEVHKEVQELLPPDAILVGQSLNCDLNAMRMMHPYVIDTSVCFNISGVRRRKSKLQKLALTFLKETIQEHDGGHDSVEDSISSLKLVKMKLANSVEFGDEVLTQKKRVHDIIRAASGDAVKNNLFAHASIRDKRTAIITAKSLPKAVQELLKQADKAQGNNPNKSVIMFELESNKEAVRKTREICLENALTLTNLYVTADQLLPTSMDNTLEHVNKWISKIYKSIGNNGLFLVLMGCAPECSSGVAMFSIKRNAAEVSTQLPFMD
uniref:Exonuclease domain-containing protein n=1 Tax=Glossina palpalis gambiensis TaxID=67801 RepID=A0A1B0BPV8_9MUSC